MESHEGIRLRTTLQIKWHVAEIAKLEAERRAAGIPSHGEYVEQSVSASPPVSDRGVYTLFVCHFCKGEITNRESSWGCSNGKTVCNNCASEMLAKVRG